MQTHPLTRDLVLIGGGHSHALVLRRWGMDPLPGARLTLINPGPKAPYSGMLPGHVAGHYARDALDIDLVRLARFAGARLVLGTATGLDPQSRTITVEGRAPIGYDVAAVDVGVTSAMPDLPGFAQHAVPAKPLGPFAQAWSRWREGTGPADAAVIGAGVAGAELAMAMAHALRARGRQATVHLVDRGSALAALPPGTAKRLRAALQRQNVTLVENARIARITAAGLTLEDGRTIAADFVTGAAGARPWPWLEDTGLALENGFVRVDATLRSSDPHVFATGDCAYMTHAPRPKAGVYAVRQAPVLAHNLRAALVETGRLRAYHPQNDYLKLISLGEKDALADRYGMAPSGAWMWRWKDRIDQRFMQQFRTLPAMRPPALPDPRAAGHDGAPPPLCGGCGAKVGATALRAALAGLPASPRPDVQVLPGDDAATLRMGEVTQVISTDHLRAVVDDPWLMARIALEHALGDIWAMGARPQAALAQVTLPRMSPDLATRSLREITIAATEGLQKAGAALAGGHSSLGAEFSVGFTVTGLCPDRLITLAGARPGDALILTKPIGTGVLLAGDMAGRADGDWVADALRHMTLSNGPAAEALPDAHAMTDVTGFGLAGHLAGMCRASGTGATLWLDAVPLLPGAEALAAEGLRSSLAPENRSLLPALPDTPKGALLADPQTAGGLLAAVPDGPASLAALEARGVQAALIGEVTAGDRIDIR